MDDAESGATTAADEAEPLTSDSTSGAKADEGDSKSVADAVPPLASDGADDGTAEDPSHSNVGADEGPNSPENDAAEVEASIGNEKRVEGPDQGKVAPDNVQDHPNGDVSADGLEDVKPPMVDESQGVETGESQDTNEVVDNPANNESMQLPPAKGVSEVADAQAPDIAGDSV